MDLKIGQRVLIKQSEKVHLATLKWQGELPAKKGLWYGGVYDEPIGKHDGTYNGVSYFPCAHPYGSFVRENKIETEMSLQEAINTQYSRDIQMEEIAGESADSKVYFKDKPIDKLRSISVNELPIRQFEISLAKIAPNLQSFDCSACPIGTWAEIAAALDNTNVKLLSCSRMKLTEPCHKFENIKTLTMCNCNYDWEEIASIVKQFPNLEALNLSGNKIESVQKCKLPESLKFIDLSNNPINSFDQLATAFGDLKNLDELNLMSCNIREIRPFGAKFPALRTLVLTGNPIQTIESFDPLNSIKSLEFLSVRDCTGMGHFVLLSIILAAHNFSSSK